MTYLTSATILSEAFNRAQPRIDAPHPLEDLGAKVLAELLAEFSADGTRLAQATRLTLWALAIRDVDQPEVDNDIVDAVVSYIFNYCALNELPEYAADRVKKLYP